MSLGQAGEPLWVALACWRGPCRAAMVLSAPPGTEGPVCLGLGLCLRMASLQGVGGTTGVFAFL